MQHIIKTNLFIRLNIITRTHERNTHSQLTTCKSTLPIIHIRRLLLFDILIQIVQEEIGIVHTFAICIKEGHSVTFLMVWVLVDGEAVWHIYLFWTTYRNRWQFQDFVVFDFNCKSNPIRFKANIKIYAGIHLIILKAGIISTNLWNKPFEDYTIIWATGFYICTSGIADIECLAIKSKPILRMVGILRLSVVVMI